MKYGGHLGAIDLKRASSHRDALVASNATEDSIDRSNEGCLCVYWFFQRVIARKDILLYV